MNVQLEASINHLLDYIKEEKQCYAFYKNLDNEYMEALRLRAAINKCIDFLKTKNDSI